MSTYNDTMTQIRDLRRQIESPEITPTIREAATRILNDTLQRVNINEIHEYAETGTIGAPWKNQK